MSNRAPMTPGGGFVAGPDRWTIAGSLTFANAASVFATSRALALPASGIVDLTRLGQADSSALAVMLSLKRRATAEGTRLQFAATPSGLQALAHVYGVDELLAS
jgi:phospholipid transport system transporter-binding protein